jgi:hypothetical protein
MKQKEAGRVEWWSSVKVGRRITKSGGILRSQHKEGLCRIHTWYIQAEHSTAQLTRAHPSTVHALGYTSTVIRY